jgi:hypothetical protein
VRAVARSLTIALLPGVGECQVTPAARLDLRSGFIQEWERHLAAMAESDDRYIAAGSRSNEINQSSQSKRY